MVYTRKTLINHNPYIRRWDARSRETYYEHRAMAEWKLGRPLKEGEVVHHEDGDRQENHPDNITIFSNQRAHMLYENYRRREAAGISHLFTIEDLLKTHGLWMVK